MSHGTRLLNFIFTASPETAVAPRSRVLAAIGLDRSGRREGSRQVVVGSLRGEVSRPGQEASAGERLWEVVVEDLFVTAPARARDALYAHEDLETFPICQRRWSKVLSLILKRHNQQHAVREKTVSFRTIDERARFCYWMFRFLRNNPKKSFKIDPRALNGRHVDFLMAHWRTELEAGRLSASSVAVYSSMLRTFCAWIDKPALVRPMSAYFDDPKVLQRTGVAAISKAWDPAGVDPDAVIAAIGEEDRRAAACLQLMKEFGLRFKESIMLRPLEAVVTREQAGLPEARAEAFLKVFRGTKGGRVRFVPIDSDAKRAAIRAAQAIVQRDTDHMGPPRYELKRSIRRLRYFMERFGVTRKTLGVSPHGLRHGFAQAHYEAIAGAPAPVRGGQVPPAEDLRARQEVAELLGHGRARIADAYLGALARATSRGVAAVVDSESAPGS